MIVLLKIGRTGLFATDFSPIYKCEDIWDC